ncbi:TVP38/TMEM64 family protein [Arcobacter sp. YIC-310]|uniref:TVP38/TMEM64 family protein n=1 Tax=Arcobacter sp. YIC-310 TaxID=3376632 RepID=UPI003C183C6B
MNIDKKYIKYIPIITSFIFMILMIILYFINDSFKNNINELWEVFNTGNKEEISNHIKSYGIWGAVILILIMVFQLFLVVFPSWLPMIIAALVYGFIPSILISLTGVFLASTLAYVIGSSLSENTLKKYISEKNFDKLDFWVNNYGFFSVVIFRISPFLSNDGVSLIAGVLGMKYLKFISATILGIAPLAIAISFFSSNIDELKEGLYYISALGILIYAVFIYFDYKKRRTK